jgi:hypothetical protein
MRCQKRCPQKDWTNRVLHKTSHDEWGCVPYYMMYGTVHSVHVTVHVGPSAVTCRTVKSKWKQETSFNNERRSSSRATSTPRLASFSKKAERVGMPKVVVNAAKSSAGNKSQRSLSSSYSTLLFAESVLALPPAASSFVFAY